MKITVCLMGMVMLMSATAFAAGTDAKEAYGAQTGRQPTYTQRYFWDSSAGKCLDSNRNEGYNVFPVEDFLDGRRSGECMQLTGKRFRNYNLRNADLRGADLTGTHFVYIDLSNARMQGVKMPKGALWLCDLRNADLSGADMSGAVIRQNTLTGAAFAGADLRGAEFYSDSYDCDLSGARYNSETKTNISSEEAAAKGMLFYGGSTAKTSASLTSAPRGTPR